MRRDATVWSRTASRAVLFVAAVALLSNAWPDGGAAGAGSAYDSRYSGESVFSSRSAGQTGQFSVSFFNAGTQPWAPGIVGLMVCRADKITCNVPSPNAAYAINWFSPTVYATVTAPVVPGQNGFFVYDFAVPLGTAPNTTATFNGDVGLLSSGALLHPEGYFHQNIAPGPSGPAALAALDPDPIAADGVSTSTLTITLVDQTGAASPAFATTPVTVTRQGDLAFCSVVAVVAGTNGSVARDGTSATAVGSIVRFTIASTTLPGSCLLAVTTSGNFAIANATAVLRTRVVGPGTKLAVSSGGQSTHPAAVGGTCSIAGVAARNNDDPSCTVVTVDVLDINGLRVTGDNTRVITATLDLTTCAGGPRGSVAIQGASSAAPPVATSTVIAGRTTFVLSSPGPYPGCVVTFTAPFLIGTSTTESWSGI